MTSEKPAVVIDNGSYLIKAGFSCDNHPVSILRAAVGRPNYLQGSYGRHPYDVYVGDEAIEKQNDLEINNPVSCGRIVHWDNMERIWHHIYYKELKVAPEDRSVIIGCANKTTIEEKYKCCEVFFETLNVPAMCIQPQSVLAMFASGITTGICVDMGHDTTNVNPIFEGSIISYAHVMTEFAGSQLSNYIKGRLDIRNIDLGSDPHTIIEKIKKEYLYITQNCTMSRKSFEKYLTLPNDEIIHIGEESFSAGEMFIQPELVEAVRGEATNILSLQDAIIEATMKCDSELQEELCDGIVLCGGLAMIPGLNERLTKELEVLLNRPVSLITSSEAQTVTWLGGATFAGLEDADKIWLKKKQYDDYGEKIIRNKFL